MNSGDITFCAYSNSTIGVTMTWDNENRLVDYDCNYRTCGQTLFCKWYKSHPIGATHQEILKTTSNSDKTVEPAEKIKGKLTKSEFDEIEMLVGRATTATNKKTASDYVRRLEFMQRTSLLEPYASGVFNELISSVNAASGRVKDKEHWLYFANQSLYKLKNFVAE